MKLLIIDNYDSFVYNLVHIIRKIEGVDITIQKNDQTKIEEINQFDKILLSPGPGVPKESGNILEIIKTYAPTKSILGICLGHQAIAEAFGNELTNLKEPKHGVSSKLIKIEPHSIFNDTPDEFSIGHYHSWVVSPLINTQIIPTSIDEEGNIMSLKHAKYDVHGLQFHPESILTENGELMIKNWIKH